MIGQRAQAKRSHRAILSLAVLAAMAATGAMAGVIEVYHADSLAGPMAGLKAAFEKQNGGAKVNLTPGTSRQLADRILQSGGVDVFASSSAAIANELIDKKAASWSVVFSANEMVVITAKGNPKAIRTITDLGKAGMTLVRITGEKDLATGRTIEFLKRAAAREGQAGLAQQLVDAAKSASSVPDAVRAVREGSADASVVYLSAAVAAGSDVDSVRFAADDNMSDAIQNAAVVPASAKNPEDAIAFVRLMLSAEGQSILKQAGQPPIVPALRKGDVPDAITREQK